jgi:hypothetical protein
MKDNNNKKTPTQNDVAVEIKNYLVPPLHL